jgi:hypothetical protein
MGKSRGKIDDNVPKSEAFVKKSLKEKIVGAYSKALGRIQKDGKEKHDVMSKSRKENALLGGKVKVKTVSGGLANKEKVKVVTKFKKNGETVTRSKKTTGLPFMKQREYQGSTINKEGKMTKSYSAINPLGAFKKKSMITKNKYE